MWCYCDTWWMLPEQQARSGTRRRRLTPPANWRTTSADGVPSAWDWDEDWDCDTLRMRVTARSIRSTPKQRGFKLQRAVFILHHAHYPLSLLTSVSGCPAFHEPHSAHPHICPAATSTRLLVEGEISAPLFACYSAQEEEDHCGQCVAATVWSHNCNGRESLESGVPCLMRHATRRQRSSAMTTDVWTWRCKCVTQPVCLCSGGNSRSRDLA